MVYHEQDPLAARAGLVVVADAVQARLFKRGTQRGPLSEIPGLSHPEGRARERELTSDVSGDTFDSHGHGRHSIQADYSAKRHELGRFAKEIADTVEQLRIAGEFAELLLVAPPKMLGAIRDQLSASARQALTAEIPKHLTAASPETVAQALQDNS